MRYVEIPQNFVYKSWITLEEYAMRVLVELEQHNQILNIANIEDVYANSTLVLDTTRFLDP